MGLLRVRHNWATSLSLSCIGEGNGNPLQCPCLENPGIGSLVGIYGVAQSQTQLKQLSSSSKPPLSFFQTPCSRHIIKTMNSITIYSDSQASRLEIILLLYPPHPISHPILSVLPLFELSNLSLFPFTSFPTAMLWVSPHHFSPRFQSESFNKTLSPVLPLPPQSIFHTTVNFTVTVLFLKSCSGSTLARRFTSPSWPSSFLSL